MIKQQEHLCANFYLASLGGVLLYALVISFVFVNSRQASQSDPMRKASHRTVSAISSFDRGQYKQCSVIAEQIELETHLSRWSTEYLSALPMVNVYDLEDDLLFNTPDADHLEVGVWSDLHLSNMETLPQSLDLAFAEKLAIASRHHGNSINSKGLCLRGVRIALDHVLSDYIDGTLPTKNLHLLPLDAPLKGANRMQRLSPGASAESFRLWATKNPLALCVQLGLADVTRIKEIPRMRGSIYLYGRGRCGFHPDYGHIEVLVDELMGELCSDHCRIMSPNCQADMVLIPVKSCDWLESYQRNLNQMASDRPGLLELRREFKIYDWRDF